VGPARRAPRVRDRDVTDGGLSLVPGRRPTRPRWNRGSIHMSTSSPPGGGQPYRATGAARRTDTRLPQGAAKLRAGPWSRDVRVSPDHRDLPPPRDHAAGVPARPPRGRFPPPHAASASRRLRGLLSLPPGRRRRPFSPRAAAVRHPYARRAGTGEGDRCRPSLAPLRLVRSDTVSV